MERRQAIRIKETTKHKDGLTIEFDNGRKVYFAADTLYHSMPLGKDLVPEQSIRPASSAS